MTNEISKWNCVTNVKEYCNETLFDKTFNDLMLLLLSCVKLMLSIVIVILYIVYC